MPRKKKTEQPPADDAPSGALQNLDLGGFIKSASGGAFDVPWHLGDYFVVMQSLHDGEHRVVISCPPQHGKTTLAIYAVVWTLLRHPHLHFAYASYGQRFADKQSRAMRDLFTACGGQLRSDFNTVQEWRTVQGGGLLACSHESGLIGNKVNVLILDDLVKDGDEAESAEHREHIQDWLSAVALQRLWVGGSIVSIGSRWHYDDHQAKFITKGYREINLQAVREIDGVEYALWPEVKPLAWLKAKTDPNSPDYIDPHSWSAAYQGKPIPRSGAMFGPPRWYESLPTGAEVVVVGCDLAYSAGTRADWSVCVCLAYFDGIYYVHDVRRVQESILEVETMLHDVMRAYPRARLSSYVSGPEKSVLNLLFGKGIAIERLPAKANKWSRSQRTAIAWKTGRILVRANQPWSGKFAREVEFFSGAETGHDDQVDALVSGFDLLEVNAPQDWCNQGFSFGAAVM